jgi:hypothetical protein
MGALDKLIDDLVSSASDFDLEEIESTAVASRLNGSQHLVNFKGVMLRRILTNEEEKVGVVGARSRVGQAAQGVATIGIPGDLSDVRSPIRSRVYSAITPGGGGGGSPTRTAVGLLRRATPNKGPLRCPVGYEFGGRFASKNFANCGRQLFDLPGGLGLGIGGGGLGLLGLLKRESQLVSFDQIDTPTVQVQRAAQIARVGAPKDAERVKAVDVSVAALSDPTIKGGLLVRRDGSTLRTKVSNAVLGTIRENPDMEGASLISAAKTASEIGDDGVASIWIGNVKSVSYALPGGGSISVERKKNLSIGEKRVLTKAWAANSSTNFGANNYGARLRDIVDKSNGTLTYTEKFPNIDKPNDLVTVAEVGNPKNRSSVQRWVFSTFMADNAPGRGDGKPYKEIGKGSSAKPVEDAGISNIKDAVKHLDENGDPEKVSPDLLGSALNSSKAFTSKPVRPGVSIVERGDGKSWYRTDASGDYAHIGERVSSDVHAALGLESPSVSFIGDGSRRSYLLASPNNESDGMLSNLPISKIDNEDLLRMSVSDWLLDQRDRNPSNMRSIGRGENTRLVLGGGNTSALAGLSSEELKSRRAMVFEDYLKENRIGQVAKKFNELSLSQRKAMLGLYEDLVKRAAEFDWNDYSARLGIDGKLSAAEKAHLDLVKTIFNQRLNNLRSAKKRYLQSLGVQ